MKPAVLAFVLVLTLRSAGQQTYWQQDLRYLLNVTLDDHAHALDGQLTLTYHNHSPDTLRNIWFHLWPNAYKNDRTALSDQLLENGETAFYFSDPADRGYINGLDFRVDGTAAKTQDHPSDIDILNVLLPTPLRPGDSITITTPFHVKLPKNFSRGGHRGQQYSITQWYPKPAVYDRLGWHTMPYLDQGEYYAEFGSYDVRITLPRDYVVAATGNLLDTAELGWMLRKEVGTQQSAASKQKTVAKPKTVGKGQKPAVDDRHLIPDTLKTLHYHQDRVHDFAWFADKNYTVRSDTVQLPSGRSVRAFSFYHPEAAAIWSGSLDDIKTALRLHSQWIGEYPYDVVSAVEGRQGNPSGMEYPTITFIHDQPTPLDVETTIFHEVGHNWFQGILANDERRFPWMDEGINTYYDDRYAPLRKHPRNPDRKGNWADEATRKRISYETLEAIRMDQPINTPADSMEMNNYADITYEKTAAWMKALESKMGRDRFDSAMRMYFLEWQFRHPYPEDLKATLASHDPEAVAHAFSQLDRSGPMESPSPKKFKLEYLVKVKDSDKYNYMFLAPVIGYNLYDGIMPGLLIHNYTLAPSRFQYALAPMFGLSSKKLNGIGRISYAQYPKGPFQRIEWSISGSHFSMNRYTDPAGRKWLQTFTKVTPGIKLEFRNPDMRSTLYRYLQYKLYRIREDALNFERDTVLNQDRISMKKESFTLHQFTAVWENIRTLYPYRGELRFEAARDFGRLTFTGNYFFNFRKKGGLALRVFAGKFFYLSSRTSAVALSADRFQLNMTGPKGYEDYTYSDYFSGRNEFEGIHAQQIMNRDGFFKVRTDLLGAKVGKTDNWLASMNLVMDIPDRFNPLAALPIKIPLKLFADFGTYADAWTKDSDQQRLLFDGGLQVSLLKNAVNIYVPLVYSGVYGDYFKSTPGNKFFQRISFTIDLQHLPIRKWIRTGIE